MTRRPQLIALLVLVALAGCAAAPVAPNHDPVVVRAEQAAQIALASYEAAIKFDHDNLAMMKDHAPAAHQEVQRLRREFPDEWRQFRSAAGIYKQTRATGDAATVEAKLQRVEELARQARIALAGGRQAMARGG